MQDLPAVKGLRLLLGQPKNQSIEGGRAVGSSGDEQRWTVCGQAQGRSILGFVALDSGRQTNGMGGQFPGELVVGVDCEILGSPAAQDAIGSPGDGIQIQNRQRPAGLSRDQPNGGRSKSPNGDHTTNRVALGQTPKFLARLQVTPQTTKGLYGAQTGRRRGNGVGVKCLGGQHLTVDGSWCMQQDGMDVTSKTLLREGQSWCDVPT